jgi:integrase
MNTKTRKSRRSLAVARRADRALRRQKARQDRQRVDVGDRWQEHGIVFTSRVGTPMNAANVRREFRRILRKTSLDAGEWTPRELRHSFVLLLSDADVPLEKIARLVGHVDTTVTEEVYRFQLRPVIEFGATEMDDIFPDSAA